MASLQRRMHHDRNTGDTGCNMHKKLALTRSLDLLSLPSLLSNTTLLQDHLLLGSGQAATALDIDSRLEASLTHSQPYPIPSSWLENPASSTAVTANTNSS